MRGVWYLHREDGVGCYGWVLTSNKYDIARFKDWRNVLNDGFVYREHPDSICAVQHPRASDVFADIIKDITGTFPIHPFEPTSRIHEV